MIEQTFNSCPGCAQPASCRQQNRCLVFSHEPPPPPGVTQAQRETLEKQVRWQKQREWPDAPNEPLIEAIEVVLRDYARLQEEREKLREHLKSLVTRLAYGSPLGIGSPNSHVEIRYSREEIAALLAALVTEEGQ